jgi:uncharacterized membrane protein YkvA (DUF1232 family)
MIRRRGAWAKRLKVELTAVYLAVRDPRTPWYARALGAAVVTYAFSPIDLIPDFIPVLGYLDDVLVVPAGIWLVLRLIPAEVMVDARSRAEEQLRRPKPVSWVGAAFIGAIWLGLAGLACAAFLSHRAEPAPLTEPKPVEGGLSTNRGVLPGLCEASTIIPWHAGYLVGDNETSDRLFAFGPDLSPLPAVSLTSPIEDIEALAFDGDRVWIVGSESATKKAKRRPERELAGLLGEPAGRLDLTGCAPCEAARERAPNDGGLNIEGAAVLEGGRWLGLRAPVVDGKALLLGLSADGGREERSISLDLGGYGVRELAPWRGGLLVVAGPVADDPVPHRLYWLRTLDSPPVLLPVELPPSTEGIAVTATGEAIVVTDGSGTAGSPCVKPSEWWRIRVPEPGSR